MGDRPIPPAVFLLAQLSGAILGGLAAWLLIVAIARSIG